MALDKKSGACMVQPDWLHILLPGLHAWYDAGRCIEPALWKGESCEQLSGDTGTPARKDGKPKQ